MSRFADHKFNHASLSNSVPFHCVSGCIPRCSISYILHFFCFLLFVFLLFHCSVYRLQRSLRVHFMFHSTSFRYDFCSLCIRFCFISFVFLHFMPFYCSYFFFHFIFLFTSFHLIYVPFPFVPLYALTIHNDILCPANTHTQF